MRDRVDEGRGVGDAGIDVHEAIASIPGHVREAARLSLRRRPVVRRHLIDDKEDGIAAPCCPWARRAGFYRIESHIRAACITSLGQLVEYGLLLGIAKIRIDDDIDRLILRPSGILTLCRRSLAGSLGRSAAAEPRNQRGDKREVNVARSIKAIL